MSTNAILLNDLPYDVIANELRDRALAERLRRAGLEVKASLPSDLADISTAALRPFAVYPPDDRLDTPAALFRNPTRQLVAASTPALIKTDSLKKQADGSFELLASPLRTVINICNGVPFADQPSGALATAFLIAPNVIVTAAHIFGFLRQRKELLRVVFGFTHDGTSPNLRFEPDDVYEIIDIDSRRTRSGGDWALATLDRPVVGRTPLVPRRSGRIPDHTPVYMIGYPLGLPQKIAGNARVTDNRADDIFFANLDGFAGNSGSPVLNAETNEVEGLIFGGLRDFDPSPTGENCVVVHNCGTNRCHGEEIVRMTEIPLRRMLI
jgi:V8-like Glu-specific endopeptidase